MRALLLVVLWLAPSLHGRADDLPAGRAFTAQLRLDQAADEALFQAAGAERSEALLTAVMENGQSSDATAEDWTYLHRAIGGLIELAVFRGNPAQAATYCGFQQMYFRTLEHDYASALAFSQQGLELQLRSAQPQAQYLHQKNIGENLLKLRRPQEAAAILELALRGNPDPSGATAAVTWREIVDAHIATPDPAAAERTLDQFLAAAVSGPPLFRGHALLAKAVWLIDREQYGPALDALQQAAEAVKHDSKAIAFQYEISTQIVACVMAAIGDLPFDEAVSLADRIGRDFQDLPLPVASLTQDAIRMRRRLAGDIEGVLRADLRRLAAARSEGSLSHEADALKTLAASYRALRAGREEIAVLEQALTAEKTLLETASDASLRQATEYDYFRVLVSLGEAYLQSRELGKARRALDDVLKSIAGAPDMRTRQHLGRLYGPALLGKARVLELDDDVDEARSILEKASRDERFDRAVVLRQWGRLEAGANERPARAAELYRSAVAEFQGQRNQTGELYARLELAHFLVTGGSKLADSAGGAKAEVAAVRRAAASSRVADALWRAGYVGGVLAENERDSRAAIAQYRNAVQQLDKLRAGLSQQEQRQSFTDNETVEDLYRRLVALLMAAGNETEAWQYLERGKARSFVEMMQGRRSGKATALSPELQEAEGRLIALRVSMAPEIQQVLRGSGKDYATLQAEVQTWQDRFSLLRHQGNLERSSGSEALSLRPVDWASVQHALPPRTALVEYGILNDTLAAFVATSAGQRALVWKADTKQLRRDILRLRGLLGDPNSGAELEPLLEAVANAVLTPVLREMPASIKGLIVVPAAYLNYLPFQVLPAGQDQRLIDRFTVSYLPSASTLRYLDMRSKRSGDLFAGALGNVAVDGWAPLPGTLEELAGIRRAIPLARTIAGRDFTHDALLTALQRHEQVHIATHGLVDDQSPLFSALLTSPAAGQPARVSLYELTNLRLRARLVVLSACETGLGKLLAGDEVAGLTRTLLQAGAETVVASLWKVSDESTALLMTGFHRRRQAGAGPAQALRESALAVRSKYSHPFYWAPFVLTGAR